MRYCPAGGPAVDTTVKLTFEGVTQQQFQGSYAEGTLAALAAITKQPASDITASDVRAVAAAGGRRRAMLQATAAAGTKQVGGWAPDKLES
jgi:hypothetical protein